jgi:hypothetical protein
MDFADIVANNGHMKNKGKTALAVVSSIGKNKRLKKGNIARRWCTECCNGHRQWKVGRPNDKPDKTRRRRSKRMAGFCYNRCGDYYSLDDSCAHCNLPRQLISLSTITIYRVSQFFFNILKIHRNSEMHFDPDNPGTILKLKITQFLWHINKLYLIDK